MRSLKLKIDPDFQKLTSPLDTQRYDELEKIIVSRHDLYPVYTWNGYVLYDHTCYKIYRKHRICYKTIEIALDSKNQAISWICGRTLEAVDLPLQYRKYLIGEKFIAEAAEGVNSVFVSDQYRDIDYHKSYNYGKLMILISKRYNIGASAIKHLVRYTKALDRLWVINAEYVTGIMNGFIKSSMTAIIDLAALSDKEIRNIINEQASNHYSQRSRSEQKRKAAVAKLSSKVTVKDMPVYDPDSYVSSLSLTIPSWICSIRRTGENSNAENISVQARSNLINALSDLITISSIARIALEEYK